MIYFPLIVKPGETIAVATRARSVYFESATGAGDTSIKVVMQGGAGSEYVLKVGQGFRSSSDYDQLLISNNKNEALITGFVVLGDAGFFDNRVVGTVNISGIVTVSGNVNTIDAGYGRSKANASFVGGVLYQVTSNFGNVQLWNPAGSGKTLIMSSVVYETADAARIYIHKTSQALGALAATQPISKRFDSAAATVAQMRVLLSTTNPPTGGTQFNDCTTLANTQQTIKFTDPIVLPQGYGLSLATQSQQAGSYLCALFDYYEE